MDVKTLWYSGSVSDWYERLLLYYHMPSVVGNYPLELQLEMLKPEDVEAMTAEQFYDFLYSKYYVWKFTYCSALQGNRTKLEKYKTEGMEPLGDINNRVFALYEESPKDTESLIKEVAQIFGMAAAAGSGLLSILFPDYYGTIDCFAVESLQKVGLEEAQRMNPKSLTITDAVVLEDIYRNKARELNSSFGGNYWTPRRIDMVLWAYGRSKCREEI